jgi:hypothetical protein
LAIEPPLGFIDHGWQVMVRPKPLGQGPAISTQAAEDQGQALPGQDKYWVMLTITPIIGAYGDGGGGGGG